MIMKNIFAMCYILALIIVAWALLTPKAQSQVKSTAVITCTTPTSEYKQWVSFRFDGTNVALIDLYVDGKFKFRAQGKFPQTYSDTFKIGEHKISGYAKILNTTSWFRVDSSFFVVFPYIQRYTKGQLDSAFTAGFNSKPCPKPIVCPPFPDTTAIKNKYFLLGRSSVDSVGIYVSGYTSGRYKILDSIKTIINEIH